MRLAFLNRALTAPLPLPFDPGQLVTDSGIVDIRTFSDDLLALGSKDLEIHLTRPLYEMLECLRCGVKVIDDNGVVVWNGYINEVTVSRDGRGYGCTLDSMANRIKAVWSGNTNSASVQTIQGETAWVEAGEGLRSQAVYGIRERIETRSSSNADLALQDVNRMLSQLAWPTIVQASGAEDGTTLYCKGWSATLEWHYYARANLDWTIVPTGVGNLYSNRFLGAMFGRVGLRQMWTVPGSVTFILDSIEFMLDSYGSGGAGASVSIWGSPFNMGAPIPWGPELCNHTLLSDAAYDWYRCPLEPKITVIPGETYMMSFHYSGAFGEGCLPRTCTLASPDPFPPRLYWNQPYGSDFELTDDDDEWMPYRIHGVVDATEQLSTIVTNSQFIVGSDILDVAGKNIAPYQDGTKTEMEVIQETLKVGTVNQKRLLATLSPDRVLHVYEEPPAADVEGTTNMVLNPSAEGTANFDDLGSATTTAVITYQLKGTKSYKCVTTAAANDGMTLTLSALANAVHFVSLHVRGALTVQQWSLDNTNWSAPVLMSNDGVWYRYGCLFIAAQANGSTALGIRQTDATARTVYVDVIQVEAKDHATAYCDGSLGRYHAWTGTAHESTSTREAVPGHSLDWDADGYFYQNDQRFTRSPIGYWIRARNLPISEQAVVNPFLFFCDRATWSNGKWEPEARDTESPLLLG